MLTKQFGSEPLLGWRGWSLIHVTDDTKGMYLVDYNRYSVWKPFAPAVAHCKFAGKDTGYNVAHDDDAPNEECGCGLYAVKDPDWLFENNVVRYNQEGVYGEVAMWGKVIETEHGYRAEFAYPTQLYRLSKKEDPGELLRLSATYGIPVMWEPIRTVEADNLPKELPRRRRRNSQQVLKLKQDQLYAAKMQMSNWYNHIKKLEKEIADLTVAIQPTTEL